MEKAKELLLSAGRLALKVTPRARQEAVLGLQSGADGQPELAVKVRAVAEDGQANAAVGAVLASVFDLPKTSLEIVRGATSRHKVIAYRPRRP